MRMQKLGILTLVAVLAGWLLGPALTHAADTVTSITVTPASVTLTADDSQTFTVNAVNQSNVSSDVTNASVLSHNDPLGSLSGATYHAGQVGTWTIQASYQGKTATATVTVTAGALKELSINPNSNPEYVTLATKSHFSVQGYDAHSNKVDGITSVWTVQGDIGTIDQNGLFSASKVGTGKIVVTSGSIAGEIPVVVKEAEPASNANTNSATNTNRAANTNGNQSANQNVNSTANTNATVTNTNAEKNENSVEETSECKTLATWLWVMILIAFLIGIAILYALVPVMRIWPAVVGLGGAIALIIVHRNYGCDLLAWWDWVLALATLGLTILALRQLPMPTPPSTDQ